jgi:hypothetical protein
MKDKSKLTTVVIVQDYFTHTGPASIIKGNFILKERVKGKNDIRISERNQMI